MLDIYITKASSFLPNKAIDNNEIEEYLGLVKGQNSKTKSLILRNNRIEERYYAIDKEGTPTHTNAEMTALAIKNLSSNQKELFEGVDLLSCGSSSPDQLMPSHGVMVHGLVPEVGPVEVMSPSGNCCSGLQAVRYAYLSMKCGDKNKAIVTGSERLSRNLRAENYEEEVEKLENLHKEPIIGFEKDFIRWMLSDGAGAFLLEKHPNPNALSLKIDWIECKSYANEADVCMYMGGEKDENGNFISYKEYDPSEYMPNSIFSIKQDTKLLGEKIVPLGSKFLLELMNKKKFSAKDINWFLPHLSSYYFQDKILQSLQENAIDIPLENWFTNLKTKGNVGSASIFLMIDELMKENRLKKGEKLLLMVPESARFSYIYCMLTVC